nr:glycosyltransferase family 4 protein [Haloferax larsenii]
MKIAQVSHVYRPSIGGIENYIYNLNNELRSRGHEVRALTTTSSFSGSSPLSAPDDAIYCDTDFELSNIPVSKELYKKVSSSDMDIFHFHNPFFPTTLTTLPAVPEDATSVVTLHGVNVFEPDKIPVKDYTSPSLKNNPIFLNGVRTVYKPLLRWVLSHVDKAIFLGQQQLDDFSRFIEVPVRKQAVIPNAITGQFLQEVRNIEEKKEIEMVSQDKTTILYVSRFEDHKNPDLLIETVTSELSDVENIEVVLIGSGESEYVDYLNEISDERISILTDVPYPKLKQIYGLSDLFVFLGTWEGLPTVILEAMAAGMPIISTDVAAIPNVITDPNNGTLLDWPPCQEQLAEVLLRYIKNPEYSSRVGENNVSKVSEEYTWETVSRLVEDMYDQITD